MTDREDILSREEEILADAATYLMEAADPDLTQLRVEADVYRTRHSREKGSKMQVSIPDAALEQAIRKALNKPDGDITPADMLGLTTLVADSSGIADLTGLEFAVNLRVLDLGSNQITDITPLAGLAKLIDVNLRYNQITDITPLAGLVNLTHLFLSHSQITDITPLAGLTKLKALDLSSNQITDITLLAGLINMAWMDLRYNQITDITPLAGLTARIYR